MRDKYKFAAIFLGGALMGVRTAGMLCALEEMGIPPEVFDQYYVVSAGGANGSYFVTGEGRKGIKI